jgi:peptide/nickel transport system substrate-binding protein
VSINLNKPPIDDPRVVEALRYAWDRQEFVDKLTFGHGVATNQPFPPDNIAYDPELADIWPYDPEQAKRLLADAGYAEGELTVTIHTEGGTFAELIQAQLKRVGIESELASIPPGQYVNVRYVQREPAITHDGTIGRESPVQSLLSSYGPEGNMNLSAPHASQEFLDALAVVRATPLDAPEYQDVLRTAVEQGVLQSPSSYLYSAPRIIAYRAGVTGIPAIPSNYRWEGVRVDG